MVVAQDSEGIKVAKVLMVEEEIWELGKVYDSFIYTRQRRIMYLWQAFALWYKDSGAQGLARQGSQIGT